MPCWKLQLLAKEFAPSEDCQLQNASILKAGHGGHGLEEMFLDELQCHLQVCPRSHKLGLRCEGLGCLKLSGLLHENPVTRQLQFQAFSLLAKARRRAIFLVVVSSRCHMNSMSSSFNVTLCKLHA